MNSANSEISLFPNLEPIRKKGRWKCPDCIVLMQPFNCQGQRIDKCPQCDGIWFDQKKFGLFKRTLDKFDLLRLIEIYIPHVTEALRIRICPKCELALESVKYSYKSGVLMERCHRCRGLWLPIDQTLKLIKLARLSQDLAPEIKGLAAELLEVEKERTRVRSQKAIGVELGDPAATRSLRNFLKLGYWLSNGIRFLARLISGLFFR